jgi:hypothetical protein
VEFPVGVIRPPSSVYCFTRGDSLTHVSSGLGHKRLARTASGPDHLPASDQGFAMRPPVRVVHPLLATALLTPHLGPAIRSIAGTCTWTGTRSFSLRASAWRTYPEHLGTDGPAADSMRSVVPRSDPAEGGRCRLSRSSASGGCAQKQPLLTVSPNLWFVESRRPSCIRPATAFGESVRHRADIFDGEGLSPRQSDRAFMQVLV